MVNLDVFEHSIKHARISGQITKRISTLKASNPTFDEVVHTIDHLNQTLQEWRESLPPLLKQGTNCPAIPEHAYPIHGHYQLYAYLGSLIAIHSILVHPWNAPVVKIEPSQMQEFRKHVIHSTNTIADASRKIIQALRHLTINAASPKW